MKNFDWLLKTPIAHRGLHGNGITENTIDAYNSAIQKGYSIEIDVRLTRDNELVVCHDDTLKRLCDIDERVDRLDLESISNLTLPDGNKIPTLGEVLDCVKGQVGVLIELKSNGSGVLESKVYDTLKSYNGNFAIQSFHPFSVRWFKTHAQRVARGLLATYDDYPVKWYQNFMLRHLMLLPFVKPDFLSYEEKHIERKRIKRLKLPKLAWTVTSRERANTIINNALCDNIIFENFEP